MLSVYEGMIGILAAEETMKRNARSPEQRR
jgi:hypothetical protein